MLFSGPFAWRLERCLARGRRNKIKQDDQGPAVVLPPRTCLLLLTLVLLLSIFFNLFEMTYVPNGLFFDAAAYSADAVIASKSNHYEVFYSENNGREGLFINMQAVVMRFASWPPRSVLLALSGLSGTATVMGLYFLASRLYNCNVGLLSSFFLSISFWHVAFSRFGLRAIQAAMFTVWFLYVLIAALEYRGSRRKGLLLAALAGFLYGLGWHTYIAFRSTLLVVTGVYLLYARDDTCWARLSEYRWKAITFAGCASLAFLPLGLHFLSVPTDFIKRIAQSADLQTFSGLYGACREMIKSLIFYSTVGDWECLYGGASPRYLAVPFVLLVAAGGVWVSSRGRHQRSTSIIILLFASGFLTGTLSGAPFHSLRTETVLLSVCMTAAIGFLFLADLAGGRLPAKATGALLLGVLVLQSYYGYFVDWSHRPQPKRNSARIVWRLRGPLTPYRPKSPSMSFSGRTGPRRWTFPCQRSSSTCSRTLACRRKDA